MNRTEKTINIIRWITRIISILITLLFLVFFFGEADFSKPLTLTTGEVFLVLFIPIMLIVSMVVAWKKEVLGGILIVASVLLFNIVAMIMEGFTLELEFGLFILIGFAYIICGVATKRIDG